LNGKLQRSFEGLAVKPKGSSSNYHLRKESKQHIKAKQSFFSEQKTKAIVKSSNQCRKTLTEVKFQTWKEADYIIDALKDIKPQHRWRRAFI